MNQKVLSYIFLSLTLIAFTIVQFLPITIKTLHLLETTICIYSAIIASFLHFKDEKAKYGLLKASLSVLGSLLFAICYSIGLIYGVIWLFLVGAGIGALNLILYKGAKKQD